MEVLNGVPQSLHITTRKVPIPMYKIKVMIEITKQVVSVLKVHPSEVKQMCQKAL
jgi:hypothetical protein